MTNPLLFHQPHGVRQELVFFDRHERLAHTGRNGRGVRIEALRNGFPAEIGIRNDADIAGSVVYDQRADFILLEELPGFLDRGRSMDAAHVVAHIVFDFRL